MDGTEWNEWVAIQKVDKLLKNFMIFQKPKLS